MVNMENYEEYMLLAADGELSEAEQQALHAFIKEHPELEKEWSLYNSARLQPDEAMVYTGKEALLKQEPKVISMGKWWMYAAAACVVMLIAIPLLRTGNEEEIKNTVAEVKTTISKPPIKPVTPLPEDEPGVAEQSAAVAKTGLATHTPRPQKQVVKEETPAPEKIVEQPQPAEEPVLVKAKEPAIIEQKTEPQPVDMVEEPEVLVAEQVAPVVEMPQPVEAATDKDFFAWLPVDDDKKKGLEDLSVAITGGVEKVKNITKKIKGADVSVKIGRSELFVVKF